MKNFFEDLPVESDCEVVESLASFTGHGGKAVRLERLVSRGHASPVDFWYQQDEDEWVMLLRGEACLLISEGENEEDWEERLVEMGAGDFLDLPAGLRHRVESVSTDAIWLALHGAIEKV